MRGCNISTNQETLLYLNTFVLAMIVFVLICIAIYQTGKADAIEDAKEKSDR